MMLLPTDENPSSLETSGKEDWKQKKELKKLSSQGELIIVCSSIFLWFYKHYIE